MRKSPGICWRIRAIKPSIHHDRDLALAERRTGLPVIRVYQGLWSAADREGRFPWLIDELQRGILPWDFDRWPIEQVLAVLIEGGWLVRYEADGCAWGWVPRLAEHQRFNAREAASSCPEPPPATIDAWCREYRPGSTSHDAAGTPPHQDAMDCDADCTRRDAEAARDDSSPETRGAHAHARARTCNAPLGTGNLELEGGEELATFSATPGKGRDDGPIIPPPVLAAAPSEGLGGRARKRQRPECPELATPRESGPQGHDPLDEPATGRQLATLAAMAVERGTTLPGLASQAGLQQVRKRDVTALRARLEAMPKLPAEQLVGGKPVIWPDLCRLLLAGEAEAVSEQLASLPASQHRSDLWRRVETLCRERLPANVDPGALLNALGLEHCREDLPRLWAAVESIRAGDRSLLPQPPPDSADWCRAEQATPRLCWVIEHCGNGSAAGDRSLLEAALADYDHRTIFKLCAKYRVEVPT